MFFNVLKCTGQNGYLSNHNLGTETFALEYSLSSKHIASLNAVLKYCEEAGRMVDIGIVVFGLTSNRTIPIHHGMFLR